MVRRALVLVLLLGALTIGASVVRVGTGHDGAERATYETIAQAARVAEQPPVRPTDGRMVPVLVVALAAVRAGTGRGGWAGLVPVGSPAWLPATRGSPITGRAPPRPS